MITLLTNHSPEIRSQLTNLVQQCQSERARRNVSRRPQQQPFVEAAGPVALEIERDVSIPGGLDLAYDRGPRLRIERACQLVATDLDARQLVMVPDAIHTESERVERLLGALDPAQLLVGHFRMIRDARRQTRRGGFVPARQARAVRQLPDLGLPQIDFVERTAGPGLARPLPGRPGLGAA